MYIYVTGANGYLGGHLTYALEREGHTVVGYDSHGSKCYENKDKPWKRNGKAGIKIADYVIALGWYTTVGDKQPTLQIESQERTMQLIDSIKDTSIRFIFTSSASVYGHGPDVVLTEEAIPYPNCAYSKAKYKTENYIREYLTGRYYILRLGSLMGVGAVGYRTKTEVIVNAFAVEGFRDKLIKVWNPTDFKPILHVKDTSAVICEILNRDDFPSGMYNICEGCYQAKDIAKDIAKITGAQVKIVEREGITGKSCQLGCAKFRSYSDIWRKFIDYKSAAQEFEYYVESPVDRNTPWN